MDMSKKAVVRLAIALLFIINFGLSAFGINPIPITEAQITDAINTAYTFVSACAVIAQVIWVWWKDAPMTDAGKAGHELMKALKEDGNHGDIIEREDTEEIL